MKRTCAEPPCGPSAVLPWALLGGAPANAVSPVMPWEPPPA